MLEFKVTNCSLKVARNSSTAVNLISYILAQKVTQYFGFYENLSQRPFKNSQSGHTARMVSLASLLEVCRTSQTRWFQELSYQNHKAVI